MKKRFIANFKGLVQGVGFRYTTHGISKRYAVKGYVKNLKDGSVELVAEGEEGDLQNFLKAIQDSQLGSYIRDLSVEWLDFQDQFQGFEITY